MYYIFRRYVQHIFKNILKNKRRENRKNKGSWRIKCVGLASKFAG